MGGVDRTDQNIAQYRIAIRSKKWWWALFAWIPDLVMTNSWMLYRQYKSPKDPSLDLLGFRRDIVKVYFTKYMQKGPSKIKTTNFVSSHKNVSQDIRFDRYDHFSEPCPTTKRCAHCRKSSRKWCKKCGKGIHDHCFNDFHGFH